MLCNGPYTALARKDTHSGIILAHFLFLNQRQTGQLAQQQTVHAGMRNDGGAALRVFGNGIQRGLHACKTGFVVFAAGRTAALRVGTEGFRIALVKLIVGEAVPLAAVQLDEVIQHMNGAGDAGDSLRCLPGAKERTAVYGFQWNRGKAFGQRGSLLKAQ